MRRSTIALTGLLLLLSYALPAQAQWALRDVAWTWTTYQDTQGNARVFDTFYYYDTRISSEGQVQFSAPTRDPQDAQFSGPLTYWVETEPGIFEFRMADGQPLPGVPGDATPFLQGIRRMDLDHGGSTLLNANFPSGPGNLIHDGDAWNELVRAGDPVERPWSYDGSVLTVQPGYGPFHAGRMAFTSILFDLNGQDIGQTGLFIAELGQPLRELIRTRDDVLPDVAGGYLLQYIPGMPSQEQPILEMNDAGQLVFTAEGEKPLHQGVARVLYRVSPQGVFSALWSETGTTSFALSFDLTHVRMNAAGQVAVAGVVPGLGEGVWVFDGAQQARPVLDYSEVNTYNGENLVEVIDLALTDDGRVVVQAYMDNDIEGIWAETERGLERVVRLGDPIPGIPGKEFGGVHGVGGMVVNTDGLVAFAAGIREVDGQDQFDDPNGLWIGGPSRLDLVAQTEEWVEFESGYSEVVDMINLPGSPYGTLIAESAYATGAGGWGTHFSASGELAFVLLTSGGPILSVASRSIVVNSTGDLADSDLDDGICDTGLTTPEGDPVCSLRAAIQQANANPGRDKIDFLIPQDAPGFELARGVWHIRPNSELPVIEDPVDLLGTTDGLGRPDVWIEGSNAGANASGMQVGPDAAQSLIRELVIGDWSRDGIHLAAVGARVEGCYVGAGFDGSALPNGRHGVRVTATGVEIGGPASPRTVITNSLRHGVSIEGPDVSGVLVANCQLGAAEGGIFNEGNGGSGVFVDAAPGCLIGGEAPDAGNTIGRNGGNGVTIQRDSRRTLVVGNAIGTSPNGLTVMPNGRHGVYVEKSARCRIERNKIYHHDEDGDAGIRGSESVKLWVLHNEIFQNDVGISMWRCNQDFVSRNLIHFNQCGVDVNATLRVSFTHNRIENNQDNTCTGLHAYGSTLSIVGNTFTGDAGNGISLQDGSSAAIQQNLIYDNVGFGVENFDEGVQVDATGNWWGDPSGPGGDGQGSGDEVGGNVDFSNWAAEEISLVVAASADTVFLASGESDELGIMLRNWTTPSDVVDFSIVDEQGWVLSSVPATLALDAVEGAQFNAQVEVPAGVSAKMPNTITISATSQADPLDTSKATVVVIPYAPVLDSIVLSPDSLQLAPGWVYDFVASGIDQQGAGIGFTATWQASGGLIDANGRFTAGGELGTYQVTVRGPGGNPVASTVVEILDATVGIGDDEEPGADEGSEIPRTLSLQQNYPNPFNPRTTIRFGLPQDAQVRLEIYDLRGRRVQTLLAGESLPAGFHERIWQGVDDRGRAVASGVYLYRLRAGSKVQVQRMTLIR